LAAEKALLEDKVRLAQQDKLAKWAKEDAAKQEKFIDGQVEDMEAKATCQQQTFRKKLLLIEASLGKERAADKRVYDEMVKDQADTTKREMGLREKATKEKIALQKMEMSVAGDVLSFGLELLGQDAEARKKHHSLYTTLTATKIIIDGTKEVQQIWEYSAENPANAPTVGAAGIIMSGIQTAIAVGRTAVALSKLGGGGGDTGDNTSDAKGGATGTGASLAVSPMGQLMQQWQRDLPCKCTSTCGLPRPAWTSTSRCSTARLFTVNSSLYQGSRKSPENASFRGFFCFLGRG
jgi:hypothetical protein